MSEIYIMRGETNRWRVFAKLSSGVQDENEKSHRFSPAKSPLSHTPNNRFIHLNINRKASRDQIRNDCSQILSSSASRISENATSRLKYSTKSIRDEQGLEKKHITSIENLGLEKTHNELILKALKRDYQDFREIVTQKLREQSQLFLSLVDQIASKAEEVLINAKKETADQECQTDNQVDTLAKCQESFEVREAVRIDQIGLFGDAISYIPTNLASSRVLGESQLPVDAYVDLQVRNGFSFKEVEAVDFSEKNISIDQQNHHLKCLPFDSVQSITIDRLMQNQDQKLMRSLVQLQNSSLLKPQVPVQQIFEKRERPSSEYKSNAKNELSQLMTVIRKMNQIVAVQTSASSPAVVAQVQRKAGQKGIIRFNEAMKQIRKEIYGKVQF